MTAETLYELWINIIGVVRELATFATTVINWVFTKIPFGDQEFMPITVILGIGIGWYLGFAVIKFVTDIIF